MNNPFIFGEVVDEPAFCDREREQADLYRDLSDSQKIFLISPRRYGKTSLLKKVLAALRREGFITIYVDLYRASSLQSLLELYCSAIAGSAESAVDRAVRFISEVLPRLRPKITIDAGGAPSIGIEPVVGAKDLLKALDDAFDLPQAVADRKKKRVVVVFDEFQEIANFEGDAIEKIMRSHIQGHRKVGYVFSGSKKHMLEEMALGKTKAFYKIGKVVYLQKIPRTFFQPFLKGQFERCGYVVEDGAVEKVLELTEDIPYNAQYLCHELWDVCRDNRMVRRADVTTVMSGILDEQTQYYIQQWDALSLNHRATLKALSVHGGGAVYSQDFLTFSGIRSLSTLQTVIRLLIKKGIVEKSNGTIAFDDVFFREWIKTKM